jgi:hypothetical protein
LALETSDDGFPPFEAKIVFVLLGLLAQN